jgi:hypothetical protein
MKNTNLMPIQIGEDKCKYTRDYKDYKTLPYDSPRYEKQVSVTSNHRPSPALLSLLNGLIIYKN